MPECPPPDALHRAAFRPARVSVTETHAPQAARSSGQHPQPHNTRAPRITTATKQNSAVLTTDFFGFDTSDNHYGLQDLGAVSEVGDAVLGLLASRPSAPKTTWVAVRNVSDPQIKAERTLKEQANAAAQIYKGYGRWSTICSAIALITA